MKKIDIKIVWVFVMLLLMFGSCKKWIDTDININPDAPQDAPIYTILSSAETSIGFNTVGGNDLCRVTAFWLQYFQGVDRQSLATSNYILQSQDVNNLWNTNYTTSMMNLKVIIDKSYALDQPWYRGVAQVLMANSLGITTDFWNNIPYSDAFQGSANLTPKFNTQEEIYNTIQSLLDSAIVNLSKDNPGYYDDIQGDMMYGGDLTLWVKAAYAFKARYALHLSKVASGTAYANALAALPNALESNDEDLQQPFDDNSPNPLAMFMDQRGDLTMHSYFIDLLKAKSDPRLTVFATKAGDGTYYGNDFGGVDWDASYPGSVASYTEPVPLITNTECLFIKTEAEFKTGVDEGIVRTDLVAAVSASMDKAGVLDPVYIATYDSTIQTMAGNALFHEIMVQKYIALYYQAEAFNDWRRTDNEIGLVANSTPASKLPPGSSTYQIPRRYLYPTDEINYNTNTPSDVTNIWQRVWWDVAPAGSK